MEDFNFSAIEHLQYCYNKLFLLTVKDKKNLLVYEHVYAEYVKSKNFAVFELNFTKIYFVRFVTRVYKIETLRKQDKKKGLNKFQFQGIHFYINYPIENVPIDSLKRLCGAREKKKQKRKIKK
ncbi:hypothetical protein BpHYR1_040890 [Brachionus plicatilis]|uniref:Uncharacterized protein n=1 Tax=Brachionus plicatilis TaxID=10195 RepID=A0A3M7RSD8_BRAPC|nr:hypothetical protein BpHYR1_040890 [Brachionus plicatilis]